MKDALRRLSAYLIDILLVYFISALISSVIVTNTNSDEFLNTYNEFVDFNEIYANFFKDFGVTFSDNKLTKEEYTKLIEDYNEIAIGLDEYYQDEELSQKEYNEIYDDTMLIYDELYVEYNYKLSKVNIVNSVLSIVLMIIYFIVIQYFTNGQTLGKKILKLRVCSNNREHITINNLILRSLIITDIVWSAIRIYCLYTMNAYGYYNASMILNSVMYFILFISLIFVIWRKDGKSLQDLLAGTKVIKIKE